MATYVRTFEKTIPANAIEVEIGKLTPPKGQKYHILGIAQKMTAAGEILGYVQREKIHIFNDDLPIDANHVLPIDITLTEGQTITYVGTDTSGADNPVWVMLVYEILPV